MLKEKHDFNSLCHNLKKTKSSANNPKIIFKFKVLLFELDNAIQLKWTTLLLLLEYHSDFTQTAN